MRACIKENNVLKILILRFIFNHIFGPNKDKLICHVFVFCRGMSNVICDLVLCLMWMFKHFMNISWCSSIPVLKISICNTVFYSVTSWKLVYFSKVMDGYEISEVNLGKNKYIVLSFLKWCFKLFFKRGHYEEHS